ncbi:glycoside hydrolase family 3 protein [Corynebacterium cystitidis]|uniref:glycoside hydrolase family 3 protein n=1 Tax=Corynebacterium cystitidis TaxID=35757 RepID=UPI00211DB2E3|nr:glycoside hydrolase family 3 N-terminal domain-containing protein [Corynebacterium cystitidis]
MTPQRTLSARTKNLITVDGLEFKDLDGDGQLTPYEDWRLSPRERAEDLVARMTDDEKAGLMIIGSHYPANSAFLPNAQEGKVLHDEDFWADKHPMTGLEYPEPMLLGPATDKSINERHQRFFIYRDNLPARDLAVWTNAVQEIAESSRLGIPAVFACNPLNIFSVVPAFGDKDTSGVFSGWPSELGLAGLRDADRVEKLAAGAAAEWRAAGIHKVYGYMADVASEPRWARFANTFGEAPQLVADYVTATVRGLQQLRIGESGRRAIDGVACTVKHFPGGGVREDGHDPHFAWGKFNNYPTENALYTYHIPPFQAAIEAGVSSIMPYYAVPVNESADQLPRQYWQSEDTQFEEVAFAFNKTMITDILRGQLGHTGYVNSDSGVLDAMPWGVEDKTQPERIAAAVNAGVDIFSDVSDPSAVREAIADGLNVDESVTRLLVEIFELGLFDDPFVDEDAAAAVIGNPHAVAAGHSAQRDSVTLLRNSSDARGAGDGPILPLDVATTHKIYTWVTARTKPELAHERFATAVREAFPQAVFVDKPEDADVAIVWVRPEIALFTDDKEDQPLSIDPRDNQVDVDRVIEIQNSVPTITLINVTNPWLLGEIEPHAAALVATFDSSPQAIVEALCGADGGPKGQLAFSFPRDVAAFADSPRDVPGKFLGEDYAYVDRDGNVYQFGYGQRL